MKENRYSNYRKNKIQQELTNKRLFQDLCLLQRLCLFLMNVPDMRCSMKLRKNLAVFNKKKSFWLVPYIRGGKGFMYYLYSIWIGHILSLFCHGMKWYNFREHYEFPYELSCFCLLKFFLILSILEWTWENSQSDSSKEVIHDLTRNISFIY